MTRLCRTFQTAPAGVAKDNTAKYLESAFNATGFQIPDWLVPDIEDGTAPNMKETALENIIELSAEYGDEFAGEIWPRVQWAFNDKSLRDAGTQEIETLVREAGDQIDGIVVPKVGRHANVERAAELIAETEADYGYDAKSIELSVIIETAQAKSDLKEIASLGRDGRLTGLVFGPVDYMAELGAREIAGERPTWPGLLEDLSNEASANNLVSIGGPFDRLFYTRAGVTVYDADGYADQVERETRVGFDGSWSLYPKQTEQANRIQMPAEETLAQAVRSIEEFSKAKDAGSGAVTIDGQMVDEATLKNFANTVDTVVAISQISKQQTTSMYDEELLKRAKSTDTQTRT